MSAPEAATRHLLAATADLLGQGRSIDRLSRPITAAALIGLVWLAGPGRPFWTALAPVLVLVTVAGLAEAYLALRVGFDAALFHRLAGEAKDGFLNMPAFDAAMTRLGLLPGAKAGRPVAERCAGARRLLVAQGVALATQVALAVLGAVIAAIVTGWSR